MKFLRHTTSALLLLLLVPCVLKAQDEHHNFFSGAYGFSFPVSAFASTDPKSDNPGMAQRGNYYSFSYSRNVGDIFGFHIEYFGQSNPVDVESILDAYYRPLNPDYKWSATSTSFKLHGPVFGPSVFAFLGGSERSIFEFRGSIGFVRAISPEFIVTMEAPGTTVTAGQSSAKTGTIAFGFSSRFTQLVEDNFGFFIHANFLRADAAFTGIKLSGTGLPVKSYAAQQVFSAFNISLGFSYTFISTDRVPEPNY